MIFARRLPRNIAPAEASMEDSHRFVETEQADDKNQKKKNNSQYIILPLITQVSDSSWKKLRTGPVRNFFLGTVPELCDKAKKLCI